MNFIDSLINDKDAARYNANAKKVSALLQFDKDRVTNFTILERHQCLAMISKASGRDRLQVTFCHKVLGDNFFGDPTKCIALVGLGARASPVEFPDEDFLKLTVTRKMPSLAEMLNIEFGKKFCFSNARLVQNLITNSSNKQQVPNAVLLLPKTLEVLKKFRVLQARLIFEELVKMIRKEILDAKMKATLETESDEDSDTGSEDSGDELNKGSDDQNNESGKDIEKENPSTKVSVDSVQIEDKDITGEIRDTYENLLSFLFLMATNPKTAPTIDLDPATDEESIKWVTLKNAALSNTGVVTPPPSSGLNTVADVSSNNLANALTNFTNTIDKKFTADTELAAKKLVLKEGKSWENLTEVKQWTLLNAGIHQNPNFTGAPDDTETELTIPTEPSKNLKHILKCSSSANVQNFLHTHPLFRDAIVAVDIGACAALKTGTILSSDGVYDVSNFAPHFFALKSSKQHKEDHLLMDLKISHDKVTQEDMVAATTQTVQYPTNYFETVEFLKNFSTIIKLLWSEEAIVTESSKNIVATLKRDVKDWMHCFRSSDDFGAWLITEINVKFQRFFHSCSLNEPSSIDLASIDLTKFLDKVRKCEILPSTPAWLKVLRQRGEKRKNSNQGGQERNKEDDDRKKPRLGALVPSEIANKERLYVDGDYATVFASKNRIGISPCVLDNGKNVCNRFLATGSCSANCRHKNAHIKTISTAESRRWMDFKAKVEEKAKASG